MRKSRSIPFIVLAALALTFLAWLVFRPREPVYEGKTLSAWLIEYHTNRWPSDVEAKTAIRHFGTTAAPVLLKMMSTRESPVRLKLLALVPKQYQARFHLQTANDYTRRISNSRRVGASGFVALGENARPFVPQLIALLEDKNKDVRYLAVFTLRCLGPVAKDALPALTNCLADPDFAVRDDAVIALGTIHADPESLVPLIIEFLGKYRADEILCRDAINSLRQFKTDAKPAVLILLSLLNDNNSNIRNTVTNALREIDAEAAAKAGVK